MKAEGRGEAFEQEWEDHLPLFERIISGSDLRADRSFKATHRKRRSPRRCDPTCLPRFGLATGSGTKILASHIKTDTSLHEPQPQLREPIQSAASALEYTNSSHQRLFAT